MLLTRFTEPVPNVSIIDIRTFWSFPSLKMKALCQNWRPTNYWTSIKRKNMLHTNRVVENTYDSEHTRMSESSATSAFTVSYSATFPGLYALFHRCFPFQRHSIILSRSLPVAKVSAYNHQTYWLMCHVSFRKTLSLLTPDYNISLVKTNSISILETWYHHTQTQLCHISTTQIL
jgi:hypothetical protein